MSVKGAFYFAAIHNDVNFFKTADCTALSPEDKDNLFHIAAENCSFDVLAWCSSHSFPLTPASYTQAFDFALSRGNVGTLDWLQEHYSFSYSPLTLTRHAAQADQLESLKWVIEKSGHFVDCRDWREHFMIFLTGGYSPRCSEYLDRVDSVQSSLSEDFLMAMAANPSFSSAYSTVASVPGARRHKL